MRWVVAPLAAVLAALALGACGDGGAEPGASDEATLVLDFQPNAVHAGIYRALDDGYYDDHGIDLTVREPSASTDAPKLLDSGRTRLRDPRHPRPRRWPESAASTSSASRRSSTGRWRR